jgi:hypothetical protein
MTIFKWLADKVNPNYRQGYEDGFNAAVRVMGDTLKIMGEGKLNIEKLSKSLEADKSKGDD